jgi:hypothetical protein
VFAAFIFVGLLIGLLVLSISLARAAQGYARGPKPSRDSSHSQTTPHDAYSPMLFHSAASNDAYSSSSHDHHDSVSASGSDSSCGCDSGSSSDSGGGSSGCD